MRRPADPMGRFGSSYVIAFLAHIGLLIFFILQHPHYMTLGNSTGEVPQEVEITFDPPKPEVITGRLSQPAAGGDVQAAPSDPAKNSAQRSDNQDDKEGRVTGGAVPQIRAPLAPPDKDAQHPSPSRAAVASDTRHPAPARQPRHARVARQRRRSDNPFANMQSLDFDDHAALRRSRNHGQGNRAHGPIDFSYGPLVRDGSVNAPSLSVRQIRGVSEDYGNQLSQWIQDHLFYPEDAIANGEEGATSLHIRLDRQGHVTLVRVTNQSGSYSLDAAALSIFSMRAKLPPVPFDMAGDHFDIDLTINFILIRG